MSKLHQAAGLRASRSDLPAFGRVSPAATRGPLSIAVTSGKGGVGKTQLSANIAVAFAQRGLKTLLMDADLGLASLDLALGLQPVHTLQAVLEGRVRIEDVVIEGPCGVRLLPACPGGYEMANLSPSDRDSLANAVDACAMLYDVLVTDTGAGIGSSSVSFAAGADHVILVATPDPTAMRDAYAMAKVLAQRAGVETLQFVANQVASESQGAALHSTLRGLIRRFLPIELAFLGCVPRDEAIRVGALSGEPFVLRAPTSSSARAVQSIAHRLTSLDAASAPC